MDCHLLRAGNQSRAGRLVRVDRHRVDPHQECRRRRAVLLDAPTSDAALCSRRRLLLAIHADRRSIAGCLWAALGGDGRWCACRRRHAGREPLTRTPGVAERHSAARGVGLRRARRLRNRAGLCRNDPRCCQVVFCGKARNRARGGGQRFRQCRGVRASSRGRPRQGLWAQRDLSSS